MDLIIVTAEQWKNLQAIRQKGAHIQFAHADGRNTTLPDHGGADVHLALL